MKAEREAFRSQSVSNMFRSGFWITVRTQLFGFISINYFLVLFKDYIKKNHILISLNNHDHSL